MEAIRLLSSNLLGAIAKPKNLEHRSDMIRGVCKPDWPSPMRAWETPRHGAQPGRPVGLAARPMQRHVVRSCDRLQFPRSGRRYRNIAQAMGFPVADSPTANPGDPWCARFAVYARLPALRKDLPVLACIGRTSPNSSVKPCRSLHCHQPAAPCPWRPGSDL